MDVRSPSARGRLLLPDFAGDGGYVALTGLAARPLPGCSVDYTLIFWVWHHVQDKPRAAREIARVTRPGGTLLLRAQFSDHLPRLWWLEHFPGGEEAHPVPFQPLADVRGVLEAAGWQVTEFAVIKEPSRARRPRRSSGCGCARSRSSSS